MQRSWLRLLVSAFILLAALSWGAASAFVAPAAHSCSEMAMGGDCPDAHNDHGAMPRHCACLAYDAIQLAPIFALLGGVDAPTNRLSPPRDDLMHLGLAGPPDLRPPIS